MKLSRATLAAFAAPTLPLAAVGLPAIVYLPPYYSRELGLSLSAVGIIFLVVRLIDIPLDPLIGHFIDRTRTRFGRFRPWLAAGALLLVAGALLVFMAEPGIGPIRALGGLLVLYLGYSFFMVAHTAWGGTLTDDYHERSRIFGWWMTFTQLGLLSVLILPPLLAQVLPAEGAAAGIHAMGWLLIAGAPLTALWIFAKVGERPLLHDHAPRLRDLLSVWQNPLMRRLLLVDLLSSLAPGLTGALFLFFFESVGGYPQAQASTLLLFYFAAGMLCVPLWTRLARATSKHHAIVVALIAYAVTQGSIILYPPDNFWLAALSRTLAGAPHVAPAFLLRAILADLSDAETLRSGQEKTGLFYSAVVAVAKLGYAIPVGLSYPLLAWIGFDARLAEGNSASALSGLTFLFVVPPVVLALIAAWVVRGWPIDAETQAANAAALRT